MNFKKALKRKIELSRIAYQIYLANRTFASALVLKDINSDACNMILYCAGEFEEEEWNALELLVIHWKGWLNQFEVERKLQDPGLIDQFVFQRAKGLEAWPKNINDVISKW
jgi:hypothetical protein